MLSRYKVISVFKIIAILVCGVVITAAANRDEAGITKTSAVLGSTAILTCKSNDSSKVIWSRKEFSVVLAVGRLLMVRDERLHSSYNSGNKEWNLKIENVRRRDKGQYICQNADNNEEREFVELRVIIPEAKISEPKKREISSGSAIEFNCIVDHFLTELNEISWTHNSESLHYDYQRGISIYTTVENENAKSTLVISNAGVHHSGNYTCDPHKGKSATSIVFVTTANKTPQKEASTEVMGNNPLIITVNVSSTAVLPCKFDFPSETNTESVSWVRQHDLHVQFLAINTYTYTPDDRFQGVYNSETNEWSLRIRNVQRRDEGYYVCEAVFNDTLKSNRTVHLSVVRRQAVIISPPDNTVNSGSTLRLVCQVNDRVDYLLWHHNSKRIRERKGTFHKITKATDEETKSTLTVENVTLSNSGNYSCVTSKTDAVLVYINVLEANDMPQKDNFTEVLEMNPLIITVNDSSTAILPCKLDLPLGTNTESVSWVRQHDLHILAINIYTYTPDDRFQGVYNSETNEWSLRIRNVQRRDEGYYVCEAVFNDTLKSNRTVHLSVVRPQSVIISPPDNTVNSGSTLKLVCQVDDRADYVLWYHNSRKINQRTGTFYKIIKDTDEETKSTLTVENVTPSNSGNYSCVTSETDAVFVSIIVLEANETSQKDALSEVMGMNPLIITVNVSSTAVLPCKFDFLSGTNTYSVSWVRPRDQHLLAVNIITYTPDDRFQALYNSERNEWSLRIRNVQRRDEGYYVCEAVFNDTLKSNRTVHLSVVRPQAVIISPPDNTVNSGSTLRLVCQVDDRVDYVLWYHNSKKINQRKGTFYEIIKATDDETKSTLTVENVTPSNSGNYSCVTSRTYAPVFVFIDVLEGMPDTKVSVCDQEICSACFSTMEKSRCPKDFVLFQDLCLWINIYPRKIERAQQICQDRNSTLFQFFFEERFMENFHNFLKEQDLHQWNYWIGKPRQSEEKVLTQKHVDIPQWFSGEKMVSLFRPRYSSSRRWGSSRRSRSSRGCSNRALHHKCKIRDSKEESCYFLDYQELEPHQSLNCDTAHAGFICHWSGDDQHYL